MGAVPYKKIKKGEKTKMKVEETREAMVRAIRSVSPAGKVYADYVEELCDRLMSIGAFIPPAKIGDTVYAALDSLFGEEPSLEAYEVCGYGVDFEGDIFVEGPGHELNDVGSTYCMTDKTLAEKQLAVYMQQYKESAELRVQNAELDAESDEIEECLERIERMVEEDE